MNITLTGSLGNISSKLTEILVGKGHQVTLISQQPSRAAQIEAMGATAAIGSVEDESFLRSAFSGADAVYTMVPPNFSAPDYNAFVRNVQDRYAAAIEATGISHVVNLSSSGSPLSGSAPLQGYENLETRLDRLTGTSILHLRPGGFYSNFYGSIPLIRHQGIIGNNFDASATMIMSHPHDIAEAAATALHTRSFAGKEILYIVSDRKTGHEAAQIIGHAVGRPELQWVRFPDDQLLDALVAGGFSRDAAQHYIVDMGIAIREGLLDAHYQQNTHEEWGTRSFDVFASEFAQAYAHS
ncbi:NAD-dependent dehydratase [Chitinophaga lutea]|uniref:NAD-dependent dehydratase n=1 Tax=Chitinophaga lutea TaxID=2488634 RepID=A0A3N4PN22_9BACT|nr:NAD(P)H-binding protein [Chitinophaga lutea]RPE09205.1 NAD-dependent dehydratase [Chitinophaga lutea]